MSGRLYSCPDDDDDDDDEEEQEELNEQKAIINITGSQDQSRTPSASLHVSGLGGATTSSRRSLANKDDVTISQARYTKYEPQGWKFFYQSQTAPSNYICI